jgi:adenosine kinase
MARAGAIDLRRLGGEVDTVVVAPDAPDAMAAHIAQAAELGHRLVFSPAQQIPSLPDEALHAGLDAAWMVVGNDYELEMLRSRTGVGVEALRERGVLVALTRGGSGSELHSADGVVEIPVAEAEAVVDPTGAGDAYLAGLLAGLRRGQDLGRAGRMGALAAAYVVEGRGPQAHHFSADAFAARYRSAFAQPLAT